MTLTFCKCGGIKGECDCKTYQGDRSQHDKTNSERGYGFRWDQLSRAIRRERPLCEDCEKRGKVTPSTQVHHIEATLDAPHLRYERSNLVALCGTCHERRHEGGVVKK